MYLDDALVPDKWWQAHFYIDLEIQDSEIFGLMDGLRWKNYFMKKCYLYSSMSGAGNGFWMKLNVLGDRRDVPCAKKRTE